MKIMGEKDKRFINIERKVGIFVVLALSIITLVIFAIGIQHELFTPKTKIYCIAESATDLHEGQAIKFKGFKIGRVNKVRLGEDGQVKVNLLILEKHMRWVKTDSEAILLKEGMIGDNIIEITKGKAYPLKEGDTISFRYDTTISDIAAELKIKIELLLNEVGKTVTYFNDPKGDVRSILANVNQVTADVGVTQRNISNIVVNRVNELLDELEKTLKYVNDPNADVKAALTNVNRLTTEIRTTRENIDNLIVGKEESVAKVVSDVDKLIISLKNNITGILKSVDQTVGNIEKLMKKDVPQMLIPVKKSLDNVKKITDDISKSTSDAPAIVKEGNFLVEDTRDVVGSVKKMWPIKNNIEKPEEETLDVDSYE